jgi:hypothetical protein
MNWGMNFGYLYKLETITMSKVETHMMREICVHYDHEVPCTETEAVDIGSPSRMSDHAHQKAIHFLTRVRASPYVASTPM